MKPIQKKCLRVMAEYGSSGIWVVKPMGVFRHAMIGHRALGLPAELAREFAAWIEQYESLLIDKSNFDWTAFNDEGRRLAVALKEQVGTKTIVVFVPMADHELQAEELVE